MFGPSGRHPGICSSPQEWRFQITTSNKEFERFPDGLKLVPARLTDSIGFIGSSLKSYLVYTWELTQFDYN